VHKRLVQHLAKVDLGSPGGLDALLGIVDQAYLEHDLERKRSERSSALMAEELEELCEKLHASTATIRLQNLRFQAAQDNMPQALSLFDKDGNLVVCNRRFREMYQLSEGYDPNGKKLLDILTHCVVHGPVLNLENRSLTLQHVAMNVSTGSVLEQVWPDGRIISIARSMIQDGGYLDTTSDVTENRKAIAQIAHMAHHDSLTGLPNRCLYRERLTDAVQHARRGEQCAVLYLDLDRFKAVNDTLGHPIGDALLIEVSARLKANVRDIDTLSRLGGDEFAIILRQLKSRDETHGFAKRVIKNLCMPYVIDGHDVSIGASVGIAIIDAWLNDPDEVMRNADRALYKAKADGRGVFRIAD